MTNKEIVDLIHRLGKDAKLTYWNWRDDSIWFYEDFWSVLSDTLQALGIKAQCPLCREEQEHEQAYQKEKIKTMEQEQCESDLFDATTR